MNEPRDEERPEAESSTPAGAPAPENGPRPGATSYAEYQRGEQPALTPMGDGPPRLVSLLSTLAAALILLVAIAITVLSWPDWVGEMVGGEDDAAPPATAEPQSAPAETP